jgi:hypothetical protein
MLHPATGHRGTQSGGAVLPCLAGDPIRSRRAGWRCTTAAAGRCCPCRRRRSARRLREHRIDEHLSCSIGSCFSLARCACNWRRRCVVSDVTPACWLRRCLRKACPSSYDRRRGAAAGPSTPPCGAPLSPGRARRAARRRR